MSKKNKPENELLKHNLIIRVNDVIRDKLIRILAQSDCGNIAEIARKILSNQPINFIYKDVSLNQPMEELALIRKELKSIGVNINQQTRYFNSCKSDNEKKYHADRTLAYYQLVDDKINKLLNIVSKLAMKWLQKS